MLEYRDAEWLRRKYWGEGLSLRQIGKLAGVRDYTILHWMDKYHIIRRTISEIMKGKKRRPCPLMTRQKISESLQGEKHPNWKGGRVHTQGYIRILKPDHPYADIRGYIFEHRFVVEQAIGRHLKANEFVHHINGKKDDNRLENLRLVTHHGEQICPRCGWPMDFY